LYSKSKIKEKKRNINNDLAVLLSHDNVYNLNRSRNREKRIKEFVPLEINSNAYIEQIDVVISEIKETDLFLGHNWLVEHNPEVDWKEGVYHKRSLTNL